MLIALFSVLLTVLIGGTDTPFAIPDAEKIIKKSIEDKSRRSEALLIVKNYKSEHKALGKVQKKQSKELEGYVKNHSTSPETLEKLFKDFRAERAKFNTVLVNSRFDLQQFLNEKEWATLMEAAYASMEKNDKKLKKEDIKAELRSNKRLVKVGESIEAVFENEEDRKKATLLLEDFEESIVNLLFENQNYRQNVLKTLESKNATKDELDEVVNRVEDLRTKTQDSFVDLYLGLSKLSTEKQWSKLAKQLNKFIS